MGSMIALPPDYPFLASIAETKFLRAGVNEAAAKDVPKETAEQLEACDPIEVYRCLKAI